MADARARILLLATLLVALSPLSVLAQAQPVGVVTTLTGEATLARTALPAPVALKFKDDVFERDRISTGEKSIVRVLLGGKAIVTVRELSVVTITEEPGRATVDLSSGKIGLSVAKQRMRPGETLEIRTPNAVAAVRGTVITVETAMVAGNPVTEYDVQSGTLELLQPRPELLSPGRGITVNGPTAGLQRAARPGAFPAGFERGAGSGGASQDAATEGSVQNGMAQESTLALILNPGPNPLTTPIAGATTGTLPPPPNIGTTGKTDDDIKKTGGEPPIVVSPGGGTGGGGGGTPGANVLVNPGFESGLAGWTLNGAGGVISSLGSIPPPEGQNMALIHTATGALSVPANPTLFPTAPANVTQGSRLSQAFSVTGGGVYTIAVNYNFITNAFPTQSVDDPFRSYVISPSGVLTQIAAESRLTSTFQTSSEVTNTLGFATSSSHGRTGFKQVVTQWVPETSGSATLNFDVFDRGDTIFDSAALVDATSVAQHPPLYCLRRGDSLVRTGTDPLLRLSDTPQTFDSLMVVCCDGRATLAGPLLQATDSNLTVPWSLLAVMQGGVLTTSTTEPLVRLDGGVYTFGGAGVPMFDLYGTTSAMDAETGLTLGTHRPLQHAGSLFDASNATVSAVQAVRVDNALLEASAPLLVLRSGSTLPTAGDTVQLSYEAKVTSLGSIMKLDRSALTVAGGAALSLAGGSVLRVTGDLFSLMNGSSLSLLSGPLVSLSGGSILNVTGALIGFGGSGGNLVSIANSFCPRTPIGGIPVSLTGGAPANNLSNNGPIKNGGPGTRHPPAQTGDEGGRGVGVVTTLAGTVTVARAALPAPQPLRFKDDVFLRDHIATAEKSVVRVLLGGKALVTVRELSSLTIKEETGRSSVDLTAGKIAMGVVRQRMRPGEVIEIRTPNAIAAIRGTVLVVEIIPAPGSSPGQPSYTTKVHVLHGLVEVSDPNNPGAPAAQVGTLQSWSRTGSEPFSQAPLSPAAAEQVFADLRSAPQIAEGPAEFMATVTTREQAKALAVAEFLAPEAAGAGAGGGNAPAAPPSAPGTGTPGLTDAPLVPVLASNAPGRPTPAPSGPTRPARVSFNGQTLAPLRRLYSLTAWETDSLTLPIPEALV